MYKGEIGSDETGAYTLSTAKSTETNGTSGDFIAFDLFFQVKEETQIYLTSTSSVKALDTSTGIENAARVAFMPQGTMATGSDLSAIQAQKAADNTGFVLWEPNYDVHTNAAVANASSNYGLSATTTGASILDYYGVKTDIASNLNVPLNDKSSDYFAKMTPTITTTAAGIPSTAYEQVFKLGAGITKMRIYMWVEGQDVDCENNASGGSLSYNLQFSTLSQA